MRLRDKVGIVTGAGSGIGQATALRAAAEGAHVFCVDVRGADATSDRIELQGGRSRGCMMDVSDPAAWVELVPAMTAEVGRLDFLANIAGVVASGPDTVLDVSDHDWERVLSVNLKGPLLGMRAVIPPMSQSVAGGKIVNVASLSAIRGTANLAAYSASKGGLLALTKQAALEYVDQGIRVNAISPGVIDTPILGDITPEMVETEVQNHMIRRLGRPEEVAAMAVHLVSDDADFLTGQNFAVDGGWTAR
jgi:NAD(P)-dependent dehydrogenase (short-subunit alcohol dehydrogenase family)